MELKNYFAQDDQGNILSDATCYLYERGTETLAGGLRTSTGTELKNPFLTDAVGLLQFAAPNGLYDLRVAKESRDYRIRVQFNDVKESVDAAVSAAERAEVARDSAKLTDGLFEDAVSGLEGTQSGDYFSVVSPLDNEHSILYRNVDGVSIELKRYPSTVALSGVQRRDVGANRVPITMDEIGNVPIWLDDGALEVARIGPGMSQLVAEASGTTSLATSARFVPILLDEQGNVAIWLEDGKLAAVGLATGLANALDPPVTKRLPTATDGRSLYAWRASTAKLKRSGQGQARLLVTGDSWTEYVAIPQQLSEMLHNEFGKAGEGWISVNGTYMLNGVTLVKSGWTLYDASTGAIPLYGTGIDGMYVSASGAAATLTIGSVTVTNLDIYYRQHGGTFRWKVDGGAWNTVTSSSSGALGKVSITGLSNSAHSLVIDTVGNAGTVVLCGVRAYSPATVGVEVLKAGNAGLDGEQLARFTGYISPIAADFAPDVVMVALSTNDYRRTTPTVDKYIAALSALVTQYRTAAPNCAFVFIAPADSNGVAVRPLIDYRDALYNFCSDNGHEFYNMHAEWGSFAKMNAMDQWVDDLHLNNNGAYALAARLCSKFLR